MKKSSFVVAGFVAAIFILAGALMGFVFPRIPAMSAHLPWYISYVGYMLWLVGVVIIIIMLAKRNKAKEKANQATVQTPAPSAQELDLSGVEYGLDDIDGKGTDGLFVDENAANVIAKISGATGRDIDLIDFNGGAYTFKLLWRGVEERKGKKRLYCALQSKKQENTVFVLFAVKNVDGDTAIYLDEEDENKDKIIARLNQTYFGAKSAAGAPADNEAAEYEEPVRRKGSKFILNRFADRFALEAGETDKMRIPALIAMAVIYIAVLAVGLIGYFTAFGITGERAGALCRGICLLYALITPSFLVYFGSRNPLRMPKAAARAIMGFGILGLIVCAGVGITKDFPEVDVVDFAVLSLNLSTYMIFSLVIGVIAYTYAFAVMCRGCKSGLYLGIGAAVTVLFPVASIVLMALLVLALILTLINMIIGLVGGSRLGKGFKAGWTGKSEGSGGTYTVIDESGYERTLTHYDRNLYRDDTGAFWVSDDNGYSFRRD